jgi:hypothetical protein
VGSTTLIAGAGAQVSKNHCKIRFEDDPDDEEFVDYFDFPGGDDDEEEAEVEDGTPAEATAADGAAPTSTEVAVMCVLLSARCSVRPVSSCWLGEQGHGPGAPQGDGGERARRTGPQLGCAHRPPLAAAVLQAEHKAHARRT